VLESFEEPIPWMPWAEKYKTAEDPRRARDERRSAKAWSRPFTPLTSASALLLVALEAVLRRAP